jgi:hypothetical protein
MKRHEYLIISAVCLIGFILTLAAIARAETTVSLEVIGSGAGYDTGYGIAASHTTGRYADIFAAHVEGNIANRKKHNASDGYTYGALGQVRAYYLDAYLGVGYGVAGYRSKFAGGTVWEKSMWQPHIQVGYDTNIWDLWATYHFEENNTPNKVSAVSIGGNVKIWRNLKLIADIQRINFLQSGNWTNDYITTLGIGWEL